MAVSKKRKTSLKKIKRRLVFELLPNGTHRNYIPKMMAREERWLGEVSTETNEQIDVFGINVDEPVTLGDFLGFIRSELKTLVPDSAIQCGVKVYLRC